VGVALLDVNCLLALLSESNGFHLQMTSWFAKNQESGWATCPITELGFIRIVSNAAYVRPAPKVGSAIHLLRRTTSANIHHQFWTDSFAIADINPSISARLTGHKQLTDAYLLSLAIRNGGSLVTFDRRIVQLAPPGSAEHSALKILV
jgi:uncharacterized protein